MTVLVLGGTREARDLAALLVEAGVPVISSLAGRVSRPALPVGDVRLGGFGGPEGLADYLLEAGVRVVVDATHPFAARISANAAGACRAAGVPLLRLQRPGWQDRPDAGGWHWVDSIEQAVREAERLGQRTFVTTGRQSLPAYRGWADRYALVRLVDPPVLPLPESWQVVVARGPYDPAAETALMRDHGIDVLTTKDSGGSLTEAKLQAAADLGVAVVVVRRPAPPTDVPTVGAPRHAADWVLSHIRPDVNPG